jgi:hypothetical protein
VRLLKGCDKQVTQYKAEHSIAPQQDGGECKVFKVRRVSLVECNSGARERSELFSGEVK